MATHSKMLATRRRAKKNTKRATRLAKLAKKQKDTEGKGARPAG